MSRYRELTIKDARLILRDVNLAMEAVSNGRSEQAMRYLARIGKDANRIQDRRPTPDKP